MREYNQRKDFEILLGHKSFLEPEDLFNKSEDWIHSKIKKAEPKLIERKSIKKKSKASAILFASTIGFLIGAALVAVPSPYSIVMSLALAGPLSVSLYGLKRMI